MLPLEHRRLDASEHSTTVQIGNRTAVLADHFTFWGRAMWEANALARTTGHRHYVVWCVSHLKWAVWQLPSQVIR